MSVRSSSVRASWVMCVSVLVFIALCGVPDRAVANPPSSRLFVSGGGEAWVSPYAGGHGYAIVTYQRDRVVQDAMLDLTYNTDTLQVMLNGLKLTDWLYAGGFLKGQAGFAGLLPDYYQRGQLVRERGFWASYVQATVFTSVRSAPHFIDLALGGKRWFFHRASGTSDLLTLPPDAWVLEPELRYTFWKLRHDRAFSDPHRLYWRMSGFAFGVELSARLRSERAPWGAFADLSDPDARNTDAGTPLLARAWVRGGVDLGSKARVQGMLYGAAGRDEDDLTRVRVGGLNPYVVPLAGLPWASHLPDRLGAAQLTAHLKLGVEHEVGLQVDSVVMGEQDAQRVRVISSDPDAPGEGVAALTGLGVFGDWRWGAWQLDTRLGLALPSTHLAERPHVALWIGVGKQLF